MTDINFCHFGPFFALLPPLTTWKIKILQKWKKHLEISSFYTFVTSDSHMMYGSWNKEHNRKNFLSFWTVFCPFTPLLTTQTIKFCKDEKNTRRYYHFTHMYHKWQSYDIWFLRYGVQQPEIFVILKIFLLFYPPNNAKNQNFLKNEKNSWRYHHFTHVHQKLWSHDVQLLRYGVWRTDRQTNKWKKWHIRGVCAT